jgi:NAD(P)-dependent dehydrogenase (short-subunit alcohol dehydrogenase family)
LLDVNLNSLYLDRYVVVVGCASGIGEATARLLTDLGADVHGFDCKPPSFECAHFTNVDLAETSSIDAAVDGLNGLVHGLFNCAGISPTRPPLSILKVNLLGVQHLSSGIVSKMPSGSAIVTTSSNAGLGWRARLPELLELLSINSTEAKLRWLGPRIEGISNAYSYAKEAMTVWTMLQAQTLITRGIRVNCTSPGAVQTPMLEEIARSVPSEIIDQTTQPIARRSLPAEQAWPLVFLNSPLASYINGADVPVDGGFAAYLEMRKANVSKV